MTTLPAHDKEACMDPLADLFDRWRRQGDLQALGAVFDALAPRLLPVAMHLCGHAADAEDALQQTFLLAMDRAPAFDAAQRLEPWLAGLLQNVVRNQSRHEARRRTEPLPECGSDAAGPMAAAEREELIARLRTHIDALPADQRHVLRLQIQHGLSPAAIAEVLELPPGTVRMRLHRGLEALRRFLPASLAAWLCASLPGRGLAAVKQQVLMAGAWKAAAVGAAGVGSVAMVGGALAMKKLVTLLVAVGVLGALWWWGALPPLGPARDVLPPPPAVPALAEAPLPPAVDGNAAAVQREAATPAAPAAGADEPTPTQLWGIVVDAATRAPVAGADVELQYRVKDQFPSLDPAHGAQVTTLARRTSDGQGGFRFDVERARPHRLHVVAASHAATTVLGNCGGSVVVVELTRGSAVSGIVKCVDELLANMDVRIAIRGEIELARGRTDGGGGFRFAGLPAGEVFVQVQSPRFEEKWKELLLEVGREPQVTIEMEAGEARRGSVVDAMTSAPVVDAEVSDSGVFRRVVRSDIAGRFELAGLRDEGTVHVRAPGYASAAVQVAGRVAENFVIRLQRGAQVIGRVIDDATAALGDAYVAVCASYRAGTGRGRDSDWIAARVAGDGRFQALGLRPDLHYWLLVRRSGCGARAYALPRVLGAGERHDVGDIVMQRGAGIEGRVVDDAYQAIAGAEVTVNGANTDRRKWLAGAGELEQVVHFERRSVTTDARGVFRIADLAAGAFRLTASLPRRSLDLTATRDVTIADGTLHEGVMLVLPRGKAITGTLLLANRLPADDDFAAGLRVRATGIGTGVVCVGRIARDGTFRIEGLSDDRFDITVSGGPPGFVLSPAYGVRPGTEGLRLVFEASAFVAGRVVDADGKPRRAHVAARLGMGSVAHATDGEGNFRIEVPASFRGTVGATAHDDRTNQGQVEDVGAGRTDVVITVKVRLFERR
ncbi:MAG: sigma-70 family RNA polymerase sigma factor [Planctomycetota bacterium]